MKNDQALRKHVLALLTEGDAHLKFDAAVDKLPHELRGKRPKGAAHSPWELLEHLRIAQWDILEFSRDPKHVSPEFPEGYWPKQPGPANEKAWDDSVAAFHKDLKAMANLVADASVDLLAPIPHADGKTLLREALVLADHNSYHLGQLVLTRQLLGAA
ncbi:MAG TPA: DinB family protein [Candidatus Sulfotelmatobacter sp.]|jgi:hypothetical protein|nr:DinB family protein [Candidatus Sulfotelmatobacter sp.]